MEAKNSAAAILNRNGESSGRSLLSQFSNDEFTNPEYESRFHGENSLITSLSLSFSTYFPSFSHTQSLNLPDSWRRVKEKEKKRRRGSKLSWEGGEECSKSVKAEKRERAGGKKVVPSQTAIEV